MTVFIDSDDQNMPKNANFHHKLILLLRKKLFKICHWAKFW